MIEILVVLSIIAVLAVLVYPVVIQQMGKWEALRVARDLSHLRVALEQFHNDTRNHPLYLSQTVNQISESDETLSLGTFSGREMERWNGPYIDSSLLAHLTIADVIETGFDTFIANDLYCVNPLIAAPAPCGPGMWVAVLVINMRVADFERVNALIDPQEADLSRAQKTQRGRLMFSSYGGIAGNSSPGDVIYLATPYLVRN